MNIKSKVLYNTLFYLNIIAMFFFIDFAIDQGLAYAKDYYGNMSQLIPSPETQISEFSWLKITIYSSLFAVFNIILWKKRNFITLGKYFFTTFNLIIIATILSRYTENAKYLPMCIFLIISLYTYQKYNITKAVSTFVTLYLSQVLISILAVVFLIDNMYGIYDEINEYRLKGYHTHFSSLLDQKMPISFSDSYYFDKYKASNEELSSFDYDYIKIKYGAFIDYKNFINIYKDDVKNYDDKTLIKIYQTAYNGFRWSLENNMPKFELKNNNHLKTVIFFKENIVLNEKEIYQKSLELNPNDFKLFLNKKMNDKSKDYNYLFLAETLYESLNSKNNVNKYSERINELNNRVENLRNTNKELVSSNSNLSLEKYYQIYKQYDLNDIYKIINLI